VKKFDVVIAGYICVDIVPEFQKSEKGPAITDLFTPGKLTEINSMKFSLGGAVANTGAALKKFGQRVYLNGLIGDDILGQIARNLLDKCDLSEGIKITGISGTAFGIVLAPPGVDRIFLESPGCSKIFDIEFIDFGAISESRLFHFGYPPLLREFYLNDGEQLLSLFSKVHEMGIATSLDFSLPDIQSESGKQDWLKIMKRILPFTDIFVPSLEEVLRIVLPEEYVKIVSAAGNYDMIDLIPINLIRKIGKKIVGLGVKILIIKAGHRGIYLLTGDVSPLNRESGLDLPENEWNNREIWCNAYTADPCKIKNATGAGDTAAAAFLKAILEGKTAESALKYAAIAGRNNLYCQDIYEELEDWACMEKEMQTESNEVIRLN
jgi:sugar/nucleoside kinase (ribokinase family)